jgi:alkylated DNA repair protein alkB family protein 6
VATISLGSHTVIDIHHYLSATSPSPPMTATALPADTDGQARPIAAIPLAHLLLLPRSLLILSSSLYTSHLHGISARTEDVIRSVPALPDAEVVAIANADLLGDATIIDSLRDKGSWNGVRGTRTSLTFRQAEKVLKGGAFSMALGGLKRS